MIKMILPAMLLAVLAGCATDTPPSAKYPATDPAAVRVLTRRPKQPYEVLGTVRDVETYFPPTSGASTLAIIGGEATQGLRQKAAAMGANAVVVTEETFTDPVAADTMESSKIWLTGLAIRFIVPAPHP